MCYCEPPQAYREVNRKARKLHQCCECNQNILIGETYQYASGIWDGDPDSFKTCLSCVEVRDEFQHIYGCCIAFGELMGTIREGSFYSDFGLEQVIAASESKDALRKLFKQCGGG